MHTHIRTRATLAVLATVICALLLAGCPRGHTPAAPDQEPAQDYPSEFEAKVTRVIDGDTVELANGEHVRYIGMDTPEMRPVEDFAKAATEANRKLVERETVRLVLDVEERDRYGRLLAYVYVDDTFVNAELVRRGLAQVATYPPNVKHQEEFLKLQREAREEGRGLWSSGSQTDSGEAEPADVGDSEG
jgi:micrococcal nuclease